MPAGTRGEELPEVQARVEDGGRNMHPLVRVVFQPTEGNIRQMSQ